MTKHIFKIMWNRRKQTALTGIGMFLTFLILFAVFSVTMASWRNYREPLGYDTEKIWQLDPEPFRTPEENRDEAFDLLYSLLDRNEQIEQWSIADSQLLLGSVYMDYFYGDDWQETLQTMNVDHKFQELLNVPVIEGRWIKESDMLRGIVPVVLTSAIKDKYFPDMAYDEIEFKNSDERIYKVVGVTGDFRKKGNMSAPSELIFIGDIENIYHKVLTFKTNEEAGILFEKELVEELKRHLGEWKFTLINLEERRLRQNKDNLKGPVFLLAVALFFLINAALGLFGVIWYNTEKRLSEIGLRRALGSTGILIQRLIIGETIALVTFAVASGSFFALQIPLLGIWDQVPDSVFFTSWFAALIFMYFVALICSLYPSWLASKKEPATALHYE